jgi:alkyl hydroperoxide reductase subunit D
MEETIQALLEDLRMNGMEIGNIPSLSLLAEGQHKYIRDLRMNANAVLESNHLTLKETALLAVCVAANNVNDVLLNTYKTIALEQGATSEEIAETVAVASLLSVNNVFYRFRHFMGKESYNTAPARLRMNIMMSPVLGKEFFELLSLAVSAVNGCEMCVKSHETSVMSTGSTENRVWDAIRIAAVVTGLGKVIR